MNTKHPTEWNLTPLFNSDNDPKVTEYTKQMHEEVYAFVNKWKERADYLENPKVLQTALKEFELIEETYGGGGKWAYYLGLRTSQDKNNSDLKAKETKENERLVALTNDIQFFTYNISKIPVEKQKDFLEEPALQEYKHFLERSFASAKYLLTEAEEKILNIKSSVAHSNWIRMTSSILAKEQRETLDETGTIQTKNFAQLLSLTNDNKKEVRDMAAQKLNEIFEKNLDVAENELNSILEDCKSTNDLRKITRPDIPRLMEEDMEPTTVDILLETVVSRFDISQRFYALKAKLFNVPKLAYHERNLEYGSVAKKFEFDEAAEIVGNAFNKLDPSYVETLNRFLKNGQIDVFPKAGKNNGGFCAGAGKKYPVYVLINYNNKINDIRTLAHEMGHAINYEMVYANENALNAEHSLSTAEVASTFMEDFALKELMHGQDEETQLSLMMQKLNDDVSSIQRQIACYKFEQELHAQFAAQGYLSKEELGTLFQRHMRAYMGEGVEQSAGAQNWWIYWSHIRNSFYVYSYACGLLVSKYLQSNVATDPSFIKEVNKFLGVGTSKSPKDIFADLGINIETKDFWNKGLDEIEDLLNRTEALAKKLGKI